MKVLNAVEQEAFESPPRFNSVQRKQYFDTPVALHQIAASLRKPTHQLGFLLSCGYFKAAKQFFSPHDFHPRDIEYMAQRIGLSGERFDAGDYGDRTRQRHPHLILKFYDFRAFDQKAWAFLSEEIAILVCSQFKPRSIFWHCVDLLIRERVQVLGYFRLAGLILAAINHRKQALTVLIEQILPAATRELLNALFIQSTSLDGEPVGTKDCRVQTNAAQEALAVYYNPSFLRPFSPLFCPIPESPEKSRLGAALFFLKQSLET